MLQRKLLILLFCVLSFSVTANNQSLPVKVFILAGQSNMQGQGIVTPNQNQMDKNDGMGTLQYLVTHDSTKGEYQHLVTEQGNWVTRDDVWLADLTTSGPLTVKTNKIGPELQFGHVVGDALQNPVLIIKTAWGGKSLQTDFRPPSSGGNIGPYYTLMINRIHEVLNNLQNHVPNYQGQGYQLAGVGWHQGWNDRVNQSANDEYLFNCVNLINDLRAEFGENDLPFIIATTGMSGWSETHPRALSLMEAQLAVPNDPGLFSSKNVATIDTRDFYRDADVSPSSQGYHWNSNAETYYKIGESLAEALVDIQCKSSDSTTVCGDNLYEAEENTVLNQSSFADNHAGFTGRGFIDFGWAGSFVEWPSINIDTAGYYQISFRYANGSSSRNSQLFLNDNAILELPFNSTGSWTNWATVSYEVYLPNGQHALRVEAINGGPNLDHMTLELIQSNLYEAEDNTQLNDARVTDVHPGYSGRGFVDYGGAGSYVEWPAITIPEDGTYTLSFRYANLRGTRNSKLLLNGNEILDLPFSGTGSWTTWGNASYDVYLPKGQHSFRVQAINAGPNLDSMKIEAKSSNVSIQNVYFAQNHVLEPTSDLFGLVSDRVALLKVQVITNEANTPSPEVTTTLFLNGRTTRLTMQGPNTVPTQFDSTLGSVQHKYDDSFTATIPKEWIQPGLRLKVIAGNDSYELNSIKVTAPNKVIMNMFDVHYFNYTNRDYPQDWLSELESKWPVSDIELRRINNLVFEELVIPPRAGVAAAKVISKQDYKDQTGLNFDGEQAAALQWINALQAAGGARQTSLYYLNIYGVNAGGQAGGFKGVGNGTGLGILHHELGHALSLPHWGNSNQYPYKGDMHGIPAPNNYNLTHAGPAWAFDLRTGNFIPPTVQDNAVGGVPGTYKMDPMQGGGQGDQEQGYYLRHFSDYSVNQMRNYLQRHMVKWNGQLNSFAKWNEQTGDYTSSVNNNGVQYPVNRDINVYSVMVAASGAKPDVTMIYPPIGPYLSGTIDLFDPQSDYDRNRAKTIYCPSQGCDLTVKVQQGGRERLVMLPIEWDTTQDPLSSRSLYTRAINLPATLGEIESVILYLTPDAEINGFENNAKELTRWPN
ncbi:sialate O-acetylesterase [Pleionea sediminis]|uniref:sialate O-acetylesterase n=1 Tax=Pleionea sediminis TaxID=2569479 RepID=UPI0011870A93|nr:sialate O-acetylesterase [Pleionea sediminis]